MINSIIEVIWGCYAWMQLLVNQNVWNVSRWFNYWGNFLNYVFCMIFFFSIHIILRRLVLNFGWDRCSLREKAILSDILFNHFDLEIIYINFELCIFHIFLDGIHRWDILVFKKVFPIFTYLNYGSNIIIIM